MKRRGPIAAEFAGPGPAAITLPTLFGSKKKNIIFGQIMNNFFRSEHQGVDKVKSSSVYFWWEVQATCGPCGTLAKCVQHHWNHQERFVQKDQ